MKFNIKNSRSYKVNFSSNYTTFASDVFAYYLLYWSTMKWIDQHPVCTLVENLNQYCSNNFSCALFSRYFIRYSHYLPFLPFDVFIIRYTRVSYLHVRHLYEEINRLFKYQRWEAVVSNESLIKINCPSYSWSNFFLSSVIIFSAFYWYEIHVVWSN